MDSACSIDDITAVIRAHMSIVTRQQNNNNHNGSLQQAGQDLRNGSPTAHSADREDLDEPITAECRHSFG